MWPAYRRERGINFSVLQFAMRVDIFPILRFTAASFRRCSHYKTGIHVGVETRFAGKTGHDPDKLP